MRRLNPSPSFPSPRARDGAKSEGIRGGCLAQKETIRSQRREGEKVDIEEKTRSMRIRAREKRQTQHGLLIESFA